MAGQISDPRLDAATMLGRIAADDLHLQKRLPISAARPRHARRLSGTGWTASTMIVRPSARLPRATLSATM